MSNIHALKDDSNIDLYTHMILLRKCSLQCEGKIRRGGVEGDINTSINCLHFELSIQNTF